MATGMREERLVEHEVTYMLLKDGKFYVTEHVPAQVNVETSGQFFSPQTVERLQRFVWGRYSLRW